MTNETLGLLKKLSPVELYEMQREWKEKRLLWWREEELIRLQELIVKAMKVSA